MAYFLAPYERVADNGPRPRRACSLARVLLPQRPGGPAPFDESEGMGGYAVALVTDEANAAAARRAPGILAVPDVPLIGRLGDALDAASRAELVDAMTTQGFTPCHIERGVGTDIAHASLLSVLRFMCGERRKPRHDRETGEVVLDGPRQPTKPLPLPAMAGGAFPTTGILDSCSRADESPAVGWTDNVDGSAYGGVKILSNRLRPISGDAWNYFAAGTYGPDCEVYWTDDVGANLTFYVRLTPIGSASVDGYGLARTATTYSFIRLDNDADTVLGAAVSQANASGDASGLSVIGSTLTAYYAASAGAFSSIGTRSDGTYSSSGYIAPYMTGGGASVFNVGGGTVVTAVLRQLASAGVGR